MLYRRKPPRRSVCIKLEDPPSVYYTGSWCLTDNWPPRSPPSTSPASTSQECFSLKLNVHEATFPFSACSAAWCNTHSWNNLDMQTVANKCRDSLHGDVSSWAERERERENMAASIWAPGWRAGISSLEPLILKNRGGGGMSCTLAASSVWTKICFCTHI